MLHSLQQVTYDLWPLPRPRVQTHPIFQKFPNKGLVDPCKIHSPLFWYLDLILHTDLFTTIRQMIF